jgi:serine/threonine protein kinase
MAEPEHASAGTLPEVKGLRLLQELGRSPKGIIYKARRLVEQDVVAAKILRPSRCEKSFLAALPKKAESTFVLEHKGLVRSLGCIEEDGRLVLLMDYAHGEPASRVLQGGKALPLSRALLAGLQCANSLHYAALHNMHHGRLHPGDIILGEDHARITGVGLGQRPEHAAWAEADAPAFEPLIYIAPEAMPSKPFPATPAGQTAADIYSLGAIIFHFLTGAPPFRGTDEGALEAERKAISGPVVWPADKKPHIPAEVVVLVDRMLAPGHPVRPAYEAVVAILSRALAAADKAEAAHGAQAGPETLTPSSLRGGVRNAVAVTVPPLPEAATPSAPIHAARTPTPTPATMAAVSPSAGSATWG